MITGVLKHDTKMNMSKAYTDTMDKAPLDLVSVTALALICYHVLKGSNARNCTIQVPPKNNYPNLEPVLKSPINWQLIEENYDEYVKHVSALKQVQSTLMCLLKNSAKKKLQSSCVQNPY